MEDSLERKVVDGLLPEINQTLAEEKRKAGHLDYDEGQMCRNIKTKVSRRSGNPDRAMTFLYLSVRKMDGCVTMASRRVPRSYSVTVILMLVAPTSP